MLFIRIVLLIAILLSAASIYAQSSPFPWALFKVGIQQKEEGKLTPVFRILELHCWNGTCSLLSVLLNNCDTFKPRAFYPRVQHSTTQDGTLKVQNVGTALVVQETGSDFTGDYINYFRFEYEPPQERGGLSKLVGFTGGLVKTSSLLKQTFTVQYVPVPKPYQIVKLDCGVLLPGLDK